MKWYSRYLLCRLAWLREIYCSKFWNPIGNLEISLEILKSTLKSWNLTWNLEILLGIQKSYVKCWPEILKSILSRFGNLVRFFGGCKLLDTNWHVRVQSSHIFYQKKKDEYGWGSTYCSYCRISCHTRETWDTRGDENKREPVVNQNRTLRRQRQSISDSAARVYRTKRGTKLQESTRVGRAAQARPGSAVSRGGRLQQMCTCQIERLEQQRLHQGQRGSSSQLVNNTSVQAQMRTFHAQALCH